MRSHLSRWGPPALLVAALVLSGGCALFAPYRASVVPPPGYIYSDFSAPLLVPRQTVDLSHLDMVEVSTKQVQIPFLYGGAISFSWDNASIQQALRQSGLHDIKYADCHFFTILSVYSRFTVRAYGTRGG
jgi:hypothetical protein